MNVLLTGANGFLGNACLRKIINSGSSPTVILRNSSAFIESLNINIIKVDTFDFKNFLSINFSNIDCVIHIAAIAHTTSTCLQKYRDFNTKTSIDLAALASVAGVKRFVFISSIGVNGISNSQAFTVTDKPSPVEHYAVSKLEAEIGLTKIASESGMELVIIRPPLVYGPGAPGNFGKLARLAKKNLPLPLGAINNKRSLVALDNLVDLIITCIDHPKAANQTFLVSDDHDVSTTELLQMMTRAAGKTPRLLPVPESWLKFAGKLLGKQAVVDRLCGNLQVDITHTKETLNWIPPISMEEGIRRCFVKEDLC